MKTFQILSFCFLFMSVSIIGFAQTKTEKIAVAGECGMCKSKIEKAAKSAGASYALWNVDAKLLTVKYDSKKTSTVKIEKAVASAGYDTKSTKATEEAYNSLHSCCQYDRTASSQTSDSCCNDEHCKKTACIKDGKCDKDMSCCKEAGCDKKDCCKKA
jgi:mercuric ion binding protein